MRVNPQADASRSFGMGTYWRLLGYTRPYIGRMVMGILCGLLFSGSTLGVLASFKGGLAKLFDDVETPYASWLQQNLEGVLERVQGGAMGTTILLMAAVLAFTLLRGIGAFLGKYYIEWVGQRVVMTLRNECFAHLQEISVQDISLSRTGELISRVTNDTQMVERGVSTVLGDLAVQPFMLVAAAGALFYIDVQLALISLILFPICIVPVAVFGRRVRKFARRGQERMADLASIQQETAVGARVVKAFGMEEHEKRRFVEHCASLFRQNVRILVARSAVAPVIEFISVVLGCVVLMYAHLNGMAWYELFTFLAAMVLMYDPVKKISRLHLFIEQSTAAADRIFEVLDTELSVKDRPDAAAFAGEVREIAFENVTFAYGEEDVLRDVSLRVARGECVAFVGGSGGGKTTLVSMLPRFFDPKSGRVAINGRDIRAFTQKSLRQQIGLVTQDTILFHDTVAGNIAYGTPGASREAIEQAARRAHAHDFIMALPQGYDTSIGERGMRLSGGQRQRLAIARALLRNPPILILDEATSALDTESERQVQAALDELMQNRTVLAIAHRLSTIAHADRIYVLEKGRVVEQGRHAGLLERGGAYKRLYDLQFRP